MPNQLIDHIKKVTFETEDGRTFTLFNTRVWKIWIPGYKESMTYQIRGESMNGAVIDLEEALPALNVEKSEQPEKKEGEN